MVKIYGTKEEIKTLRRIMKYGVANMYSDEVEFLRVNGCPLEIDCEYHVVEVREIELNKENEHVRVG